MPSPEPEAVPGKDRENRISGNQVGFRWWVEAKPGNGSPFSPHRRYKDAMPKLCKTPFPSFGRFLCGLPTLLLLAAPSLAQDADQAETSKPPPPPDFAFLWKVEKEGLATSHLFGTIHSEDPRVSSLHPTVVQAFRASDAVYIELSPYDIEKSWDQIEQGMLLPEGQTLSSHLSEVGLLNLKAVLKKVAMTLEEVEPLHPEVVSMVLNDALAFDEAMVDLPILDDLLFFAAEGAGKEVGGIETVEEQMKMLPIEVAVHFLEKELHEEVRIFLEHHLLPRNIKMAQRSAALMHDFPDKSYVFAYGTMHFLDFQSVVDLLKREGFTVTRLCDPTPTEPVYDLSDLGYAGD